MSIAEQINGIIDRRKGRGAYEGKGHLQVVERKIKFYEELKIDLENYRTFRSKVKEQIKNKKGDYYEMSLEDPLFEVKIDSASPDNAIRGVEEALKQLEELRIRFDRSTINISVIGKAKQGKSKLLQSISGVNDEVIPSAESGDCTGAKSVICNEPGVKTAYAYVSFYTEKEMVEQVQKYLDAVGINRTLGAFSEIPSLKDDVDKVDVSSLTAKKQDWLIHLKKYIYHYNNTVDNDNNIPISGYSSFVLDGKKIRVDESDIRLYVAQYDCNRIATYVYLAVKEVEIHKEFRFSEAGNIKLVDTIGLGDTALGIREKMINTLRNDSDASILLRLPSPTGDHIDDADIELYDFICSQMRTEVLDKWLFFVFNKDTIHDNALSMIAMEKTMKDRRWKYASLIKVNCMDNKDVENNLLLPLLEYLTRNLATVDNNLMIDANKKLTACFEDFSELCKKVHEISNSSFKKQLESGGLFDDLYENNLKLAMQLAELNEYYKDIRDSRYKEEENQGKAKNELEEDIHGTLRKISSLCPDINTILNELKAGDISARPDVAYTRMADFLRAAICDKFEDVNKETIKRMEDSFRNSIIDVLRSHDGGKLDEVTINTDSDNPDNFEWLETFINQKLQDFPLVKQAFLSVLNYRMYIEGSLEDKVNVSLKCLDPEEKKSFVRINFAECENRSEESTSIRQGLMAAIGSFAETLDKNIKDLLQTPYNSFYARIRKFREQIIFSKDGSKELKNMYRKYAPYIWKSEFASIATRNVAIKGLSDCVEKFDENNVKNKFTVKIDENNVAD